MDKTAIEAIQTLAHAQLINTELGRNENAQSIQMALPNGYTVIDTEQYEKCPNRFRGQFTTHLISDFVDYTNSNGSANTGIFVNTDKSTATAVINMGSSSAPEWGDHKASLTLKKTPEFAKLLANIDTKLDQLAFIDLVEDYPECFSFIDGTDDTKMMALPTAIATIRKLTVSQASETTIEASDFAANLSSTDKIEFKAQGNIPPKGFFFICHPYEGLSEIRFEGRLRAISDGKEVKLKYRILALDRIIDDIGVEFKEYLKANVAATDQFYCGEMAYQK